MHLVMRYLCFFGIVKRQGVKRRMDKRSTSEEQKSGYLGLTRADEERHLADVISVAQQNLERAGADIRKVNEDLADLLATYDVKDKEGLALWNNATARLKENEYDLIRYEKARKKPYFGRIDFKDGISQEEETCYIGRAGIAKNGSEPVVLDWRAPIASVYYESSMGPCTYTVSSEGTYEMDLVHKRTYEIEQDVLKDFFDSDVVANDELLTKYLAKNKKAVLGEIIATIQKEQNVIIRRSPRTNVIIQGVAGSGKTTVAMHRISYILYNYKDDFRPEDFYIVGSNRILLNYITSVLPELDVYGIRQLTMEQLFVRLLYEDWDDARYSYHSMERDDPENSVKCDTEWFLDLKAYCEEYEKESVPAEDIYLEKTGKLLIGADEIRRYLKEHPADSMESKMLMLGEIVHSRYENEILGRDITFPAEEKKRLDRKYTMYFGKGKWEGSVYAFYQDFLAAQAVRGREVTPPGNSFDVYDLAALAYIYKRIKETDPVREASHVVIDEAQDFGMMAYRCMDACLSGCTYTIMGDTSQNIHFQYGLNDWDELRRLILTGDYDAFGLLRKSYRNTVEISTYANEILRHGDFSIYPVEPIIRHGAGVCVEPVQEERALLNRAAETIQGWQRKGYETIAVICRDEEEAERVAARLAEDVPVKNGAKGETEEFGDGVMVLPVSYTKGLEFDAVLLFDPSEKKYPSDNGHVKLLYVAATRALHELTILHRGELSGILAGRAPQDKHIKEFAAEPLTKAREYEKPVRTKKEQMQQRRVEGTMDMAEREYFGPRRIAAKAPAAEEKPVIRPAASPAVRPQTETVRGQQAKTVHRPQTGAMHRPQAETVRGQQDMATSPAPAGKRPGPEGTNPSPYAFGTIPENTSLRVRGHAKGNHAVRWVKKSRSYVEMASMYGLMRITPVAPDIIRVSFVKGVTEKIAATGWMAKAEEAFSWSARESKSVVEIAAGEITVRVDKRSGAVSFWNRENQLLLAENAAEPRVIGEEGSWVFFDWDKKERIKAKGMLDTDFLDVTLNARYISFGGKKHRMPLVLSNRGYGIAAAAKNTVLLCDIKTYGQYLYAEGERQLDYYFICGEKPENVITRYKGL